MIGSQVNGITSRSSRPTLDSRESKLALSPYLTYALLFLILLFFAVIRYRLRDIPLERDEGDA